MYTREACRRRRNKTFGVEKIHQYTDDYLHQDDCTSNGLGFAIVARCGRK